MPRQSAYAPNLPPIGLNREEAAAHIGIGASKFDQLVRDGRMPPPKLIDARRVWDRFKVEKAFAALPESAEPEPDGTEIEL